jgi:hypothetical protein
MPNRDPEKHKEYCREYRRRNRERLKEWDKQYRQTPKRRDAERERHQRLKADPAKWEEKLYKDRISNRRRREERRKELIALYGGQCIRCGFDDWRALQIDHVNGGGRNEFRQSQPAKYYQRIADNVGTGEYQLLCANCNQIKKYEHGEGVGPQQ